MADKSSQLSKTLGNDRGYFWNVNPEPPKSIYRQIKELRVIVAPYTRKEDAQLWAQQLVQGVSDVGMDWSSLINIINRFFDDSPDDSVRAWFDGYRYKIIAQQKNSVPPLEIWTSLRKELEDLFNLSPQRMAKPAARELANYKYSNETPAEYAYKVMELTRIYDGNATDSKILDNLYSHLSDDMMAKAIKYLIDSITIGDFIEKFALWIDSCGRDKQTNGGGLRAGQGPRSRRGGQKRH